MKQTVLENPEIKHDLSAIRIKSYTHLKNLYQLPENMPKRSFEYFMKYRNKVKRENIQETHIGMKSKW